MRWPSASTAKRPARGGRRRGQARLRAQAAQDGADAGNHLARAERLGNVIVAAEFEADDAVDLVGTGGQEQDRDVGLPAQTAADVETADIGQADIEDDQIVVCLRPSSASASAPSVQLSVVKPSLRNA